MKNWKKVLLAIIGLLSVSVFPVVFLYCNNIDEVKFFETLQPALFFLSISIILCIIAAVICKDILKGAFISIIFTILFTNYASIERIIKKISLLSFLKYWHIAAILLFLFFQVCYFIYKRISQESIKKMIQIISIAFCTLIVINFIPIVPKVIANAKEVELKTNTNEQVQKTNYPDVYYLVLDEYSQFDVMEKYYGYYPTDFKNFLEKNNFMISDTSHNEIFWTHITNTNTLNLEYILPNNAPLEDALPLRKDSKIFELFNSYGYNINIASQNYSLIYDGIEHIAENPFGGDYNPRNEKISGNTSQFQWMVYTKTPFYIFQDVFNRSVLEIDRGITESLFNYIELYSEKSEESPKFTYVHIRSPHQPFLFDKDGKAVENSQIYNWSNKNYYLNQYIFVSNRIQKSIQAILDNNPDSIIILQSDHSARGGENKEVPIEDSDKLRILNAVYYPNSDINIEGQSGLNTIRIVINKLFGLDYELLEVPEL